MTSSPGDQRPAVRLTCREQVAFLYLVNRETHPGPRRLLDLWAHPDDAHPNLDRALTETLKAMWRGQPKQMGD